jgi:hypothetical protein
MCHRGPEAAALCCAIAGAATGDTFPREACEANVSLRLCAKQIRHSVDAKHAHYA